MDPDQTVSASGQGEGEQTEGAHRTLKDIAALYRFGLPEGRLNGKGRRASLPIASSQPPAIPPGNGSISRSRDPTFQRPLDTRRHRVNKIEGEEDQSRRAPTHRTPRPPWPCPVWVEQETTSGRPEQLAFLYGLPTGRLTVQALVFRFPTREED